MLAENRDLRARLAEAEEILDAIRSGEVDALVVSGTGGERVFTLQGADYPYRALIEAMGEGALILTEGDVIYYANQRLAEMLKTPLERVIGATFARWIAATDQALFHDLLNHGRGAERPLEVVLVAADGSHVPCTLACSPLPIATARPSLCLIVTDLTEQHERELRLLAAERLARSILEQAAGAILVCDADTGVIRASVVAQTLCGADPTGQPFAQAFPLRLPDGAAFSLADHLGDAGRQAIEARLEHPGSRRDLLIGVGPWLGVRGEVLGSIVTLTDISQRKAREDEIKQLAFFDPLTGLPNRRLFQDRLRQTLADCARGPQQGALCLIDLDNFKALNDTLGHDIGDLLLQQVGQRLSEAVRLGDTVARLGGDEFVLIINGLSEQTQEAAAQVLGIGAKLQSSLNRPYQLAGHAYRGTPSIGLTLIHDHAANQDELLKQADLALYQAKAAGRNTLRFFDPSMQAAMEAHTALESQLREGLRTGQFLLLYQPQVDGEGRLTGAEALLRWRHPDRGLILPDTFIPLAEETGLILPLGQWVLETACAQLAHWARRPDTAGLTLAVNVSARQFRQTDFTDLVRAALARQGADPHRLKLEITETLLLDDIGDASAKMVVLKALGLGFALDDFGTGYCSLVYLKRFPLDELKIDRSFVRDLLTNPSDAAIAGAILALARNFGLAVIAEGVETEAQRALLAECGCHGFQGYLFGRPGPIDALRGLRRR
nr:bifunctional diguanylate cyclase/phosphodiesterase [Thiocystis violacea]